MSLNIPNISTPPAVDPADVSPTFNFQTQHHPPYNVPQDLILFTRKPRVMFYTHQKLLLAKSINSFGKLLSPEAIEGMKSMSANGTQPLTLSVTESSEIIICLLRLLYVRSIGSAIIIGISDSFGILYGNKHPQRMKGMSIRECGPSTESLGQLFTALLKYGYALDKVISPSSDPFAYLLLLADEKPLQIYSLAAHYSFEALAVPASTKALRIGLSDVDEPLAITMGPLYLLRLMHLHLSRLNRLKSLLLSPPAMHNDTDTCKLHDRLSVQRAFGLTAGYLTWEATASVEAEWIRGFFEGVLKDIECVLCSKNVRRRMDEVLEEWKDTKATI